MVIPAERIRAINDCPVQPNGDYVLYWMVANRRSHWNFSLDRAVELCRELNKPLIVLEALRSGYEWASDRLHRFVIQGMADNRAAFSGAKARYYAYVEPTANAGRGLVEHLASRATVVVSDDFPCFFLPRMLHATARRLAVRMELVDSNGLLPMRATERVFARAVDFRRWLQKNLLPHLEQSPSKDALSGFEGVPKASVPRDVLTRWPEATDKLLTAEPSQLQSLPIDHSVKPAAFEGGPGAAARTLDRFFRRRLDRYAEHRNDPENEAVSGFSPYLHFGHLSVHEVFSRIVRREEWSVGDVAATARGSRAGWWGMSPEAESFLDEVITWRELGYNMCSHRDDYADYESLPDWARATLEAHASDPRDHIYGPDVFENATTHDPLWNAAQTQLVREGRMHNYLRMLWGKKILEWSPDARHALATMIHLNNKYAVDGRNPNSYSGILWVLGRYDRAWGPERPIFGKIRYMSSENTARKLKLKAYLERYASSE